MMGCDEFDELDDIFPDGVECACAEVPCIEHDCPCVVCHGVGR
jgi:hypothetical protein